MQQIPEELARVLSARMKLGEYAKPVCRVEVDRLAFIPGRTEEITFMIQKEVENYVTTRTYIDETAGGGETLTNPVSFRFPVEGKTTSDISSKYGMRMHPVKKKKLMHWGVDVPAPTGTKILASWSGTVVKVNENAGEELGMYVKVRHSNGYHTVYGHLSKVLVDSGQQVAQGEYIGECGSTGLSTGPHLHFEVHNPKGEKIDPYPYMTGKKKLFEGSSNQGPGVVTAETLSGYVADLLFFEGFNTNRWVDNEKITSYDTPLRSGKIEWKNNSNTLNVTSSAVQKLGFNFSVTSKNAAYLEISVAGTRGLGELRVFSGVDLHARYTGFQDIDTFESVQVLLPGGVQNLRVEVYFTTAAAHKIALDFIKVNEYETEPRDGNVAILDPTQSSGFYAESVSKVLMNEIAPTTAKLQVGQFVYMDTLVLDSVNSIDIDDQFEMDSREARITISNPDGYYSPDLNPFYFPESYMDSPWNYFINGFHYGVLSENTPIRIYMGYGLNMIRVFTGLIDKIDMETETPQLTISARDMYKKILNKVLFEDKKYGGSNEVPSDVTASADDPTATGENGNLNRRQEIISKAKYYAAQRNPKLDYRFLLAIATHETEMGTTGAGRESQGSWILGYDVHEGGYREQYKGVDNQLYYGALRYHEAMKSRNWVISTLADVTYFWSGGDKGAYQWASDTNWPNGVFGVYMSMKLDPPTDFASTPIWKPSENIEQPTTVVKSATPSSAKQSWWLKSSIINDLIVHAGLSGWRQAPDDLGFPDYIIEESYLIERDPKNLKVIIADPEKEGSFLSKDYESMLTPQGWLNPFVDSSREWGAFEHIVSDCINEVIKDTNYRVYCDRYGTFRMEQIDLRKPVVSTFSEYDNLVSLNKTIDMSRARSHVVIKDDKGNYNHFLDPDLLMELKGELRTTLLNIPYADTYEKKKQIAERFFWDIKRVCRTLQVSIPGNPALDVLDRVYISDLKTTTRSVYMIKGIKSSFSPENGYMQIIDLTWGGEGAIA